MSIETEIRALVERWTKASQDGDIDVIMAQYAPDVRAFDAIGAPQFDGAGAYREHWQTCLGFMPQGMTFAADQVRVEAAGDLAVAHFVVACASPGPDGEEQIAYSRGTQVWRRTADGWRIAHEHFSMPFNHETGHAEYGVKP
ncbi:MAG: SgcJ/EcaC family oxidoreductase [Maricaulaceae bacterium]|nr:SgcJ/EcaC family oxidoreductase [Maricaulaceae bacterium]